MNGQLPIWVCAAGVALICGCSDTPTAPSVWTPANVRDQIVATNLNHATAGARGRLTRWRVPIAVNSNGIQRAVEALDHFEQWSGGAIRFTRVASTPANGLEFVEGGARDVERGCVNVTNLQALTRRHLPRSGTRQARWWALT